ncbi:hypothetical protein BMS3Bbin07_01494 [bacterium BMS3Bbin07]|nr:hypothetical protein BMS3Bbin07_01494 [bacterium BMS3Bbin07]
MGVVSSPVGLLSVLTSSMPLNSPSGDFNEPLTFRFPLIRKPCGAFVVISSETRESVNPSLFITPAFEMLRAPLKKDVPFVSARFDRLNSLRLYLKSVFRCA